jgi:hypothetical protein
MHGISARGEIGPQGLHRLDVKDLKAASTACVDGSGRTE